MSCCKPNIPVFKATSVVAEDDVVTITIPASPQITAGNVIDVVLATSVPNDTDGSQLIITNGTITASVMNGDGNYLRFYPLTSRTVLRVQYLNDPVHFQIINVFGRVLRRYK